VFEIDLPNVAIFRKPTAAELAAEINEALASTGRAPIGNAIESGFPAPRSTKRTLRAREAAFA